VPDPGRGDIALDSILVVEDNDDSRDVLSEFLAAHGYRVLEAANGKVALDLLLANRDSVPAVIILDLEMPVMCGWEFLLALQEHPRLASIPIVVTSGNPKRAPLVPERAVVASFTKPVDFCKLLATLSEYATHR
jgi:CheY-like chemotaxis protein